MERNLCNCADAFWKCTKRHLSTGPVVVDKAVKNPVAEEVFEEAVAKVDSWMVDTVAVVAVGNNIDAVEEAEEVVAAEALMANELQGVVDVPEETAHTKDYKVRSVSCCD